MTREQWLERRQKGIGASDAACILGLNPWKSNVELWEEKTGRRQAPDLEANPAVRYGKHAEAPLRELFALDFPRYRVEYDEFGMIANRPVEPLLYIIDTLDGYEDGEKVRRQLMAHYCEVLDTAPFSLSDVDMTTARDFIDWLIEMCVEYGVPCVDTLLNRCEDIGRYLYACVANRRCALCGHKADIHEVDTVGMGRSRRTMHHLGQRVQPLCRAHHSEAGQLGQMAFDEKYHIESIRLRWFAFQKRDESRIRGAAQRQPVGISIRIQAEVGYGVDGRFQHGQYFAG